MLDDKEFEAAIQDLIIDLCEVLYRRGYDSVRIGAVMRLVGVNDENASRHDDHIFLLDDEFERLLARRRPAPAPKFPNHANITLH